MPLKMYSPQSLLTAFKESFERVYKSNRKEEIHVSERLPDVKG